MELEDNGLVFSPSLEVGGDRGFLALIGSLVTDIYNTAKLIPRLAKGRLHYKVSLGLVTAPPPSLPPTATWGQNLLPDAATLGCVCVSWWWSRVMRSPGASILSSSPGAVARISLPRVDLSLVDLVFIPSTPPHPQRDAKCAFPPHFLLFPSLP